MYKEHQTFFQIHTRDGFVIPIVPTIKILGLSIDGDRSSATAFGRLIQKMNETIQLVKRITRKHAGMGEKGLLRLIQAFVVPHISYLAPFLALDAVKLDKLNKKMRKLYKVALGIPVGTNNQRLEEMGIHNTIEEIIEAQRVSHTERLMHTSTGRKVLQDIGHIITNGVDRTAIPGVCLLDIRPLPRHMHPDEHQERRLARAKALTTIHNSNPKSFFTDVSEYPGMRTRFAIAVINGMGETVRQASTRAQSPSDAEEIAIALAYTIPTCEHILSDSKSAITNYARNWITKHTSTLLRKAHNPHRVTITWYPAHTQSSPADGNERAHQSARNLTRGELSSPNLPPEMTPCKTFKQTLEYYKHTRRKLRLPEKGLTRHQEVTFRRIQSDTLPTPARLRIFNPQINDRCRHCKVVKADLEHILSTCHPDIQNPHVQALIDD